MIDATTELAEDVAGALVILGGMAVGWLLWVWSRET
jgi:hypothetical protein